MRILKMIYRVLRALFDLLLYRLGNRLEASLVRKGEADLFE